MPRVARRSLAGGGRRLTERTREGVPLQWARTQNPALSDGAILASASSDLSLALAIDLGNLFKRWG
jgi:hypothetical protein